METDKKDMTRPATHFWECKKVGCVMKRFYMRDRKHHYVPIGYFGTKCLQVIFDSQRRPPDPEALAVLAQLKAALSK